MTADPLTQVRRAARKAALARIQLEQAIRAAGDAGIALRTIGAAADVSYETVRRILAR